MNKLNFFKVIKKIVILMLFFLPALVFAQNLRFTVLGEPQISWMVPGNDNISRNGAVIGINAGMLMDVFFAENYALSTGVTISNLGGKLSYNFPLIYQTGSGKDTIPSNSKIIYKLQYISVPVGFKFKTNQIGYTTYTANLGINPMINIRARASDSGGITEKSDISEEISFFNINYFIFLGVQYSLGGSSALTGGLGYSSGFVDVTNRAADKININTVTIRLGILF